MRFPDRREAHFLLIRVKTLNPSGKNPQITPLFLSVFCAILSEEDYLNEGGPMKSCFRSCFTCGVLVVLALIALVFLLFHGTPGLFR
jgi:hypothetical protein